jgi:threonine aldolase
MHSFGSDNHSGVHPEVLAAIGEANRGHAPAYGADPVTERAIAAVRSHLGEQAEVAFVFNGTGANVVGLGLALHPWQHVICAESAHIAVDECGAPERLLGTKLVTVYTPDEIRALADTAHTLGAVLHLDGARIANAAASLGVPLAATTADCGVDVLSFGGTKNGLLGGEAVVVLRTEIERGIERGIARGLPYQRKQLGQLGSKGRYLGAQFAALLEGDLWLRNARRANAMARRLADGVRDLPGTSIAWPVQANAVFVRLPAALAEAATRFGAYPPDEGTGLVRLMCSWDTTEDDVDALLAGLRAALPAHYEHV